MLFPFGAFAQIEAQPADTSGVILPVDTFLAIVKRHHPVAQQARLREKRARAERLRAGGRFDPKLYSEMAEKQFDQKDYFQLQNSGLEIPTWYGLTAKAGYERNQGVFLNNQNTVPGSGLWFGEVSLTLVRGLFIDERRAALRQAKILQESAEFEINQALNLLLERALIAYWDWYRAHREQLLMEEAVELAQIRFGAVKEAATVGDLPFIDTLEAAIQLQDRRLRYRDAQANFYQKRNHLASFLWFEGTMPLGLQVNTRPVYSNPELLNLLPENWLDEHPQLKVFRLQLERLDWSRRLALEQLKPQVDVSYKFLNQPTQDDFFAQYSPNNYQWALRASFPILLRSGRGQVLQTKVQIEETDLQLSLTRLELKNRVEALQLELNLVSRQLVEARSMAINYGSLLAAERIKFANGESSLFLVNRRELRYIESRQKAIEVERKLQQVRAQLLSAAGVLHQN